MFFLTIYDMKSQSILNTLVMHGECCGRCKIKCEQNEVDKDEVLLQLSEHGV